MNAHLQATLDVPRRWIRVVRVAECIFIVVSLLLLLSLPFPPYAGAVVPFFVLSVGSVWAGLTWWGLKRATRGAWWAALVLALVWSLNSVRTVVLFASLFLHGNKVLVGDSVLRPAMLLSYAVAMLAAGTQFVVMFAWWRAIRTAQLRMRQRALGT